MAISMPRLCPVYNYRRGNRNILNTYGMNTTSFHSSPKLSALS